MTGRENIVIIGAGQAGAQVVVGLRKRRYQGKITMIGDEPTIPYQRPPLSKSFLEGKLSEERLHFRPASFYSDNEVITILNQRVIKIDRCTKCVKLAHNDDVPYDKLIIATGSRPKWLPELRSYNNVFALRNLEDSKLLAKALLNANNICILGGGYIGLEVAAIARKTGKNVTVLEKENRLLARVAGNEVSSFYQKLHSEKGVNVICNAHIERYHADKEGIASIQLADKKMIKTDFLLLGIGALANEELAQEAGLACHNGIDVSENCVTSDKNIYAAGDCTRRPVKEHPDKIRLESVHNAIEQGELIASHITKTPPPVTDAPWFWSDQYDIKLQTVGISSNHDDAIVIGALDEKRFTVFYALNGYLIAADCINDATSFMVMKQLFKKEIKVPVSHLYAPDFNITNLKDMYLRK